MSGDLLYDIDVTTLEGKKETLRRHEGKVMLIVNVASKCGLTPHYEGLEALQREYADRGFTVLGFPCNQFGRQEPGTAKEIRTFCESNYDVTFPLYEKIDVNGRDAHVLYRTLTAAKKDDLGRADIQWNFEKFLIDKQGAIVARFEPKTTPEELRPKIEALL